MTNNFQEALEIIESLRAEVARLDERLSWAIQLTDDNNQNPDWKDRLNAEIDQAIAEDREFWANKALQIDTEVIGDG